MKAPPRIASLLRAVLAVACGLVLASILVPPIPPADPTVRLDVATPVDDVFQLYYTNGRWLRTFGENGTVKHVCFQGAVQSLVFPVPRETLRFRLDLGTQPVPLKVVQVRVQTGRWSRRWSPRRIVTDFLPGPDIGAMRIRDGVLEIDCRGADPFLVYAGELPPILARLKQLRRAVFAGTFCLGALLAWLFLHFALWRKARRLREAAVWLTGAFFLILLLPTLDRLFGLTPASSQVEKRWLAPLPKVSLARLNRFPAEFAAYFGDHFGFRLPLIHANNAIRARWLACPSLDKVLLGRKRWLFLAREHENRLALDAFRAPVPLSEGELARWLEVLEENRRVLAAQGIAYLPLIPPDKDTIYPEFVPRRTGRPGQASRLDQLREYARARSGLDLVDLRPGFRRAKRLERIYYRSDSHWNTVGALLGCQQLLDRARQSFPEIPALFRGDYVAAPMDFAGDLAIFLALPDLFGEYTVYLQPRSPLRAVPVPPPPQQPRVRITECPDVAGPRVVMFHDSFGNDMRRYLSELFPRIVFCPGRGDPDWIEREKPDLVIQEFVERTLNHLDPDHLRLGRRAVDRPPPSADREADQ